VDRRPEPGFAHGYAEVEVLDDGRPRSGSSGTGLGLLGVRERLAAHGGVSEIGPRVTGGYRVRVRMPLPEDAS
jgi:signal transduction histidine kinase